MQVIGGFGSNANRTTTIQDYILIEEIRKSCTITPIEESIDREFKFIINDNENEDDHNDHGMSGYYNGDNINVASGHGHNQNYNHNYNHSHGHGHNQNHNDGPLHGDSDDFIEMTLREMDRLHEAYFTDWIRDENNLGQSQRHLTRIAMEYPIESIINGLKWLMDGWSVNGMATIFHALLLRQCSHRYYYHCDHDYHYYKDSIRKSSNDDNYETEKETTGTTTSSSINATIATKDQDKIKDNDKNENQGENEKNKTETRTRTRTKTESNDMIMENGWRWCFIFLGFIQGWSSDDQILLITIIINEYVKRESKRNQRRIKPILLQLIETIKIMPFHFPLSSLSSSSLDSTATAQTRASTLFSL